MANYLYALWAFGGGGIIIGFVLLQFARKADAENYIIQKATPMPLKLVNERDDVWLRGESFCESPIKPPHFFTSCLHYDYKLEERVTETYTDSKGHRKTRTKWVTRETKEDTAFYALKENDLKILIDGYKAQYKHLPKKSDTVGRLRHSINYLPHPTEFSAIGNVSEKRERLETYENIPLIITTKTRAEFIKDAEFKEKLMRGFGSVLPLLGITSVSYGLFDWRSWPVDTSSSFNSKILFISLGIAFLIMCPIWIIHLYNTFIEYRQRITNAWHQIDVDLKMRCDLIPQLVSTVKGFMTHEKELFESLSNLRQQEVTASRDQKIEMEQKMTDTITKVQVVVEKYPELKANTLIQKLTREMTAIEEKIAHGRIVYNEAVQEFNDNVLTFPKGIFAKLFGFKAHPFFQVESYERESRKINL